MKRILLAVLPMAILLGLTGWAPAQTAENSGETAVTVTATPLTESDIALLRQDLQTRKMEIITGAMDFTETEAKGFWPVYRDYANEQQKLGDKKCQMIKEYAQSYDQMTNDKAAELTAKMLELDRAAFETKTAYWPRFQQVLGAKRAAKFYQVERRLGLMVDLQLASEIPVLD